MNHKLPPATPYVVFGLAWAAYAVFFPFYNFIHFIPAAVVALIAGFTASRFTMKKPRPEPVIPRLEEQAAQLDAFSKQLRGIAAGIRDSQVSASALKVSDIMVRMAEDIEADPSDARRSKAFTRNYIPTAIGVYENYAKLEKQNVNGENISGSMAEIRSSLGSIESAFAKQLDAMFMDDAIGIKTDIDVISSISSDVK